MKSHSNVMSSNRSGNVHNPIPVRYVLAGVFLVAIIVMFPLLAVWKQAYINSASLIQKDLADSVSVLSQRASRLRISVEELTSHERIERLAHDWLNLSHPPADRIVIVQMSPKRRRSTIAGILEGWKFFAMIRRSLEQERG